MNPAINNLTRADAEHFKLSCDFDNANSADLYQTLATKSAIYPGQGTPLGLAYVALKLNGEAGELAEHVGKAMRDDGLICAELGPKDDAEYLTGKIAMGPLTPERRALIIKEIGDIAWYLSAACNELEIDLSEVLAENLFKLADRTERDALRGSGDDR